MLSTTAYCVPLKDLGLTDGCQMLWLIATFLEIGNKPGILLQGDVVEGCREGEDDIVSRLATSDDPIQKESR